MDYNVYSSIQFSPPILGLTINQLDGRKFSIPTRLTTKNYFHLHAFV